MVEIYAKVGGQPLQRFEADRVPQVGERVRIRASLAFDRGARWYDVRCSGITDDLGNDVYQLASA